MDFRNVVSEPHFLDKDTEVAMIKYHPILTEYSILAEYNTLREQCKLFQDVYVVPSAMDPLRWFGLIFLRSGHYSGGVFRFQIIINKIFPQKGTPVPTIIFNPPIFHPKVDPVSGNMETISAFSIWETGVHHIWHLLLYIKKSLLSIDINNCINHIAADLFTENIGEYKRRAIDCVQECQSRLNDPCKFSSDPHYLHFSSYNPNIHGTFRKVILAEANNDNISKKKPLSWVKPGSLEPCSSLNNN